MERNLERTPLGHGTIAFGSRRGTSSHQYNPAVILAEKGTTETAGSCYGMLFVYSGNFSCEAEKDQFNQTRLLLGLNEELFSYPLAEGETFTVPKSFCLIRQTDCLHCRSNIITASATMCAAANMSICSARAD